MKYIFLLLTSLLIISCTTYQKTYSTYDEVYDSYTPSVESSDVIEGQPVNIYFNVIDYDLWTYKYPNYRRYWFYNNYSYIYPYSNYSIYNNYNWFYTYPNYWSIEYSWNYYYWVPFNYNYYSNYWNNNWYYGNWHNTFYYSNHHNNFNHQTHHHRPNLYRPRSVSNNNQIQHRKPFVESSKPEQKPNKPLERPKQDPYLHSRPSIKPVSESVVNPSRFESDKPLNQSKVPVRTQTRPEPKIQPSQNNRPNNSTQRPMSPKPQVQKNKPKR